MLILGQKSCFLGPNIFEIPQPNRYYYTHICHLKYSLTVYLLLSKKFLIAKFDFTNFTKESLCDTENIFAPFF